MKNLIFLALLLFCLPSFGSNLLSSAVASSDCDEQKIREITGDAMYAIRAQQWANGVKGFMITLDISKMTFGQLTKKMNDAGCFASLISN